MERTKWVETMVETSFAVCWSLLQLGDLRFKKLFSLLLYIFETSHDNKDLQIEVSNIKCLLYHDDSICSTQIQENANPSDFPTYYSCLLFHLRRNWSFQTLEGFFPQPTNISKLPCSWLVLPQAQGCGYAIERRSDCFCFLYTLVIKPSDQREFWGKGGLFAV